MKKIKLFYGLLLIILSAGCQFGPTELEPVVTKEVIPCQPGEVVTDTTGLSTGEIAGLIEDNRASTIPVTVYKNYGVGSTPSKNYYSSVKTMHNYWSDGSMVTDSISSIHVYPGWEVIIYRYTDYSGDYKVLGENSSPTSYWGLNGLIMSDGLTWDNRISSMEIRKKVVIPSILEYKKSYPSSSEFGDEVNVNEVQGIANNGYYWYLTNEKRLYKCEKNNIQDAVDSTHVSELPVSTLSSCDHFGDLDYYGGYLWVPLYKQGTSTSYVVLYNSSLNYVKYAKFPSSIKSAAWVSINPVNGLIYATSDYKILRAFDSNFSSGDTLKELFTVTLDFGSLGHSNTSWWDGVWNQGGEFGPDGLFYYVLDHSSNEYSGYTGFYIFKIDGHAGRAKWRANIQYDPDRVGGRRNELQGITFWDRGSDSNYPGQVHILYLDLDAGEDDCSLRHYAIK